jgi:hypothetical protein
LDKLIVTTTAIIVTNGGFFSVAFSLSYGYYTGILREKASMYTPNFTITNRILKNMGIIEAAKEVIENAPLVPAWEAKFREDALVRTVHHGTHIEGNDLSLTEAERLLAGAKIVGRERDIQEVLNYRNVLKFIENYDKTEISEESLKHIHEQTVHRIYPMTQSESTVRRKWL